MDLLPSAVNPCNLLSRAAILRHSFWTYTLALIFILTLFPGFTARAEDIGVYGPEQFTRSTGNPVEIQKTIAVTNPSASYRVYIVNGGLHDDTQIGELVSSSTIYWNGSLIAGPSNFSQQTSTLTLPVTAQSTNTLTVELRGKPGGSITVQLLRGNQAPIAHAGADQTLYVGDISELDGSTSTDSDGDTLSYRWHITAAPASSLSQLSDSSAIRPELPIDRYGQYQVDLIVNDGFIDSAPDQVIIDTLNSAPVANAGADQSAFVGGVVDLDGGASHDVDDDPLSYRWNLTEKPIASNAVIIDDRLQQCHIAIDQPGHYVVQLIVNDGILDSEPDLVGIDTQNSKPVANAGADQIDKVVGMPVELDGSLSSDVDGDALTYLWSMLHQPAGGNVVIQQADQPKATFTPDQPGDYVGQLIVNDGQANSDPATTLVTVSSLSPVNNAPKIISSPLLSATVGAGYSYSVDAQDADGDALSYSLTTYPTGMTVNAQSGLITWIPGANQTGVQSVTVSVSDGKGGSDSQSYSITVTGTEQTIIPNVVDQSRAVAEQTITQAKLNVGSLTFQHNAKPDGSVISQSLAAGSSVEIGTVVNLIVSLGPDNGLPPDPVTTAPKLDSTVATTTYTASQFLYSGSNPIQTGVQPGTIEAKRAAVIRGKVLDKDNNPLPGVAIAVKDHPEFGQTLSRADGQFDMVANGGGLLTLNYQKSGYLPAQRQVTAPWQDYVFADTVILVQQDANLSTIDLNDNTHDFQVAQGSQITDTDGVRQATLLIPKGTQARIYNPDGTTSPVTTLNLRLTEYTVGANGPAAMPGPLPPSSAYTYAFEMKAEETDVKVDGKDVLFDRPVPFYIDNFLSFPVGTVVPVGYYDRDKAAWIPSDNGQVIRILAINNGIADIDSDNDNLADDAAKLSVLGITPEERTELANLYQAGKTLWRVQVTHLSTWDCNWPYKMPDDAVQPKNPPPVVDKKEDDPCKAGGSIIECENQVLGETLTVTGTPFTLNYRSDRVPGRKANTIQIPVSGDTLPSSLKRIDLIVDVAGQHIEQSLPPTTDQTVPFTWNGFDAFGRPVQGAQPAVIRIGYAYAPVYATPAELSAAFGRFSGVPLEANRTRQEVRIWQEQTAQLEIWSNHSANLGAWSLNKHHAYDPIGRILHQGDGSERNALNAIVTGSVETIAGDGTLATFRGTATSKIKADGSFYVADTGNSRIRRVTLNGFIITVAGGIAGFSGDGGQARYAQLNRPDDVAIGPDGSVYIADTNNKRIRRIDSNGIITTVAGNGASGFSGDGGPATQASIDYPSGIAVAADGSFYFSASRRIRKVGTDGIITTVAGNGITGFSGDGGPATQASLYTPTKIEINDDGSLYFPDWHRIRQITADGIIRTVAGNGTQGFSGDGGLATQASLNSPTDVAIGRDGGLYIADANNYRIRRIDSNGMITTVAGNGTQGFRGDGGPAIQASLGFIISVAVAADDSLYIGDLGNVRVRRAVLRDLPKLAIRLPQVVAICSINVRSLNVERCLGEGRLPGGL